MKKLILFFVMVVGFSLFTSAQEYRDVVYLRNGSMIYGTILELIPNEKVKIKTADGSVFVYRIPEVDRIVKEEIEATPAKTKKQRNVEYREREVEPRESKKAEPREHRVAPEQNYASNKKQNKSLLRGYKGFVDAGYIADVSDHSAYKFQALTSHGFQFNNYLYLGGGLGLDYYIDYEFSIPVFVDFRANFINRKITPFADLKVGYAVGDEIEGVFCFTSVGARFNVGGKKAINVALALNYQEVELGYYSFGRYTTSYYYATEELIGLGVKVGFEF